jgi:hypothetical protein
VWRAVSDPMPDRSDLSRQEYSLTSKWSVRQALAAGGRPSPYGQVTGAYAHSRAVASFGTGDRQVEIRRIGTRPREGSARIAPQPTVALKAPRRTAHTSAPTVVDAPSAPSAATSADPPGPPEESAPAPAQAPTAHPAPARTSEPAASRPREGDPPSYEQQAPGDGLLGSAVRLLTNTLGGL